MDKNKFRWRSAAVILIVVALAAAMCITCTSAFAVGGGAVTWYIAEGSTAMTIGGPSFQTSIALNNPGATVANVHLTYMIPSGPVVGPKVVMPAGSAAMVDVGSTAAVANQWSVATKVVSDVYVSAEDQVYYNGPVTAAGSNVIATTSSVGTTLPATTWYLAEGSTGVDNSAAHPGKFETYIEVQNTNTTTVANVKLTYLTPKGPVVGPSVAIAPDARHTFVVAATPAVANEWSVSTTVTSDQPVVAERSTYWEYWDSVNKVYNRGEGTSSIGSTGTAFNWYLPEGSTGITPQGATINPLAGNFETWILVQNPNDQPVGYALNFLTPTGVVNGPQNETLAAGSRQTYDVSKYVPNQFSVATQVVALDLMGSKGVVAERAMYWTAGVGATAVYRQSAAGSIGWSNALQSSAGAGQPTHTWEVSGCRTDTDGVGASNESWILVMSDPVNTAGAHISITYLKEDGTKVPGPVATLAAGTRQSFRVNDTAGAANLKNIAAIVNCTNAQNIMVEHSTYFSTNALPVPTSNRNNAMDTICTNQTMAP